MGCYAMSPGQQSQYFRKAECLHLWGLTCLTLKKKALHSPEMMTTLYQLTHCNVLEVLKCYLSCNNIKSHTFPIIILYCVVMYITFGINILYLYSQRAYLSYNCIKIRIVNSFQSIERHKWFNTPHLVTC